jgi:hypothetical protein
MLGGVKPPIAPQKGLTPMAKKAELLEKATELKLEVSDKNTIAEIEAAIAGASTPEVAVTEAIVVDAPEEKLAKAGKRSAKAIAEVEAKAEKEARKEAGDTSSVDGDEEASMPKGPKPVTRPLIERRGKSYRKVAEKIESAKLYTLADAVALALETNPSKFDATVEFHVRLGVDPRQADQNIRATVSLPNGTGKKIIVAVFAPEADHAAAKAAGADIVGDETFLAQLDKEDLNFLLPRHNSCHDLVNTLDHWVHAD